MKIFLRILKYLLIILLGLLIIALLVVGALLLWLKTESASCEAKQEVRAELTEGRTELSADCYGADQRRLKLIDGGVYEIPGIPSEDIVCSTVYWFGQPNGEPLKILLSPDSEINEPVHELDCKGVAVGGIDAPTEYAEIVKSALNGDIYRKIESKESRGIKVYLGEDKSFWFSGSVYLSEAMGERGRVYYVRENDIYHELEDRDGFYDWLDENIFGKADINTEK